MINLNNLTPWDIEAEDGVLNRHHSRDNRGVKQRSKGSFNISRPSTLPHRSRAKTPVLIEILEATKQSITSMKKKRLSFDQESEKRLSRKKKLSDFLHMVPLAQNEFPIQTSLAQNQYPERGYVTTVNLECPQMQNLESLIESERKCLKLHSMPPLKVKPSHRRKSHSQLTLHNLHYFEPRKTQFHDLASKTDYNSLNKNLIKEIKKKEISPSKKVKTVIAFQTVRIVKFQEKKPERSPKKAFSKVRVEHFLDSLLERMK